MIVLAFIAAFAVGLLFGGVFRVLSVALAGGVIMTAGVAAMFGGADISETLATAIGLTIVLELGYLSSALFWPAGETR